MPRAGPLKQILRPLPLKILHIVRTEHCPRVSEYGGDKTAYVDRIRNSIKRLIDDGDLTHESMMTTIYNELRDTETRQATTRIRSALTGTEVSPAAGDADTTGVREKWLASEFYQALRYEFRDQPYSIKQEASFGRNRVDLLIAHEDGARNYIVEVKLAGSYSSRERLLSQVRRYRKKVPDLSRTYVLMIAERKRDLPGRKDGVQHTLDEVRDEPRTEVLLKEPGDLSYTIR